MVQVVLDKNAFASVELSVCLENLTSTEAHAAVHAGCFIAGVHQTPLALLEGLVVLVVVVGNPGEVDDTWENLRDIVADLNNHESQHKLVTHVATTLIEESFVAAVDVTMNVTQNSGGWGDIVVKIDWGMQHLVQHISEEDSAEFLGSSLMSSVNESFVDHVDDHKSKSLGNKGTHLLLLLFWWTISESSPEAAIKIPKEDFEDKQTREWNPEPKSTGFFEDLAVGCPICFSEFFVLFGSLLVKGAVLVLGIFVFISFLFIF